MFKRLWNAFWRPSARWGLGVLLLFGIAAGVVGWNAFHAGVELTSTTEFCISCHTMRDNNFEEYKTTIHYSNPHGVRAGCPDCHVPKTGWPLYWAKLMAAKDLWGEIVGTINTREKFEDHRLELAQQVWDYMKQSDSRECRSCHSFEAMDFAHQEKPDAATQMQQAMKDGGTCIDCHKGIAHHMPDMSSGYKLIAKQLQAAAATLQPKVGDTIYPIATVNLYVNKPDSDSARADGKIIAATPLKVTARDGDWLTVEIGGWQQEGAERVLYALQGQRIFNAALAPAAVSAVKAGTAMQDADTGQTWTEVTLTAWVKNADMTEDLTALWNYGNQMFSASCALCHSLPDPAHYLANAWIGNLNAMKPKAPLDDEQFRFLQKYVQMHAQDTGGDNG